MLHLIFERKLFTIFISLLGLGFVLIGSVLIISDFEKTPPAISASVKAIDTDSLTITTIARPEVIQFKLHPEKRIPRTNNWDTYVEFQIQECGTLQNVLNFSNVSTDNLGNGVIYIPAAEFLLNRAYAFKLKAYSHLTKQMGCYPITTAGNVVDFTPEGDVLAGDASVVSDNYVNSLDISNTVRHLFSGDYKNDLNQDSEVNSLDLSNEVYNLFVFGD